jgi:hypothetical protein
MQYFCTRCAETSGDNTTGVGVESVKGVLHSMKILGNQKFWQVVGCLLCFVVAWIRVDTLGASEFGGGRITGFILVMAKDGSYLFLFAILLTFGYPADCRDRSACGFGAFCSSLSLLGSSRTFSLAFWW